MTVKHCSRYIQVECMLLKENILDNKSQSAILN